MKKDLNTYINIRLENFNFFHRATNPGREDSKYIHRDKPENTLRNWLLSPNRHGTYLVSGYRGVGKSSLVGAVVGRLKKEHKRKYIDVCVNIGQENINELNILQIIAKNLHNAIIDTVSFKRFGFRWYQIMDICESHAYHILWMCILTVALLFVASDMGQETTERRIVWIVEWTMIGLSSVSVLAYAFQKFLRLFFNSFRAIDRLERLCARFNRKTTYRRSVRAGVDQFPAGTISQDMELLVADIQEIEYELTQILAQYKRRKVIIVLDELDKTEPLSPKPDDSGGVPEFEKVSTRPEQHTTSRSRRMQVLNVIANMKYFLSTADAYFIFIAGRELFEASMADLSDRDFSISNIFNGILNVDSFYSHPDVHDSIAYTEEFVCRQILPERYSRPPSAGKPAPVLSLRDYRDYRLAAEAACDRKRLDREVVFLYHFVSYLAFISNGSPKKITTFFERYVCEARYLVQTERLKAADTSAGGEFWLSFGYNSQMKINFVHYIAYPVLQNIMSRSTIFGDKLQVSDSFLLGHIFKMHQGGFSWRNLEHTPEILEINHSPEIRDNIAMLIKYLNHTLLTTISCGLYQYKFPSRFAEEISFFSKLSEEFSALFNFSLDELQPIKKLYYSTLEKQMPDPDRYVTAAINHSLGDVYMQEENFSVAIRHYEKCVELVSVFLKNHDPRHEQFQNYVLFYNRTMLKLGLAHEKRHTDNSAYAVYNDLTDHLLAIKRENPMIHTLFRDNRTMHLGVLARLNVIEKLDTTGIREVHIEEAITSFGRLMSRNGCCGTYSYDKLSVDDDANIIVMADFFRKLGDILYYKNVSLGKYSAQSSYMNGMKELLKPLGLNERGERGTESSIMLDKVVELCLKVEDDKINFLSNVNPDILMYNLAILLESIGHTHFQVLTRLSFRNENIGELSELKQYIIDDFKRSKWPKFSVHRAMICYWAASKLYGSSCERDLVGRCYKEIMHVVNYYINGAIEVLSKEEDADRRREGFVQNIDLVNHLQEIADFLTRRFIMTQFRQYEHVNFSEITNIGRILRQSDPRDFADHLSLYPSIEEMQNIYVRFVLLCHRFRRAAGLPDSGGDAAITGFVRKNLLHEDIYNSTLTNIVTRYQSAAKTYRYFIDTLLCAGPGAPADYFRSAKRSVKSFLEDDHAVVPDFIRSSMEPEVPLQELSEREYRFELLKAIVAGAVKNTSYIIQTLAPMQNTLLFNHSFRGRAYYDLAVAQSLLDALCDICGYDPVRYDAEYERFDLGDDSADAARRRSLHALFDSDFLHRHRALSNLNYLVENVIHSFAKARQCSSQGTSYQEMIRGLYFLDDDLNNDTIQFYLAIERACMSDMFDIEKALKRSYMFNHTSVYRMGTYLRTEFFESAEIGIV